MRHLSYHYGMKTKLLILALLSIGCTQKNVAIPTKSIESEVQVERSLCSNDPIKIAVIDTGFGYKDMGHEAKHLCKFGHRNFSSNSDTSEAYGTKMPIPVDHHGHGTNIVGVIEKYAGNVNYCIVIIKFYDPTVPFANNLQNTVKAFKYAKALKVDIVNYSAGGLEFSQEEKQVVTEYLNSGGRLIAAAGNESADVEKKPYYPAMYDKRIVRVGNMNSDGSIAHSSNFGKGVSRWEPGTQTAFGIQEVGTSQAAAVATGKIIKSINRKCVDNVSK